MHWLGRGFSQTTIICIGQYPIGSQQELLSHSLLKGVWSHMLYLCFLCLWYIHSDHEKPTTPSGSYVHQYLDRFENAGMQTKHAISSGTMRPKAFWQAVCTWVATPGAASAATETLLRDPHLRGQAVTHCTSAHIALMFYAPLPIGLQAQLSSRKYQPSRSLVEAHASSPKPMWSSASKTPCEDWAPANTCSNKGADNCVLLIKDLSKIVDIVLEGMVSSHQEVSTCYIL